MKVIPKNERVFRVISDRLGLCFYKVACWVSTIVVEYYWRGYCFAYCMECGAIGPSSVRVEPVLSSSGDHTVEKVTESRNNKAGNRADVATLLESIKAISERFFNTAYGFFLVKRVAYTVGANYVRNNWVKYGLVKPMLNSSNELFFFQFSSLDEDVGNVSVWVKLYDVPVTAFSENGLSVIATKLDTHLMLDSYTSDICMQSWGRSSYARAIIELRADDKCPKNIGSDVAKNLKNPSHAPKGVPVGPKVQMEELQIQLVRRPILVDLHCGIRNQEEKEQCTFCGKDGHNEDGCFKVIGYPDWWPGKDRQWKQRPRTVRVEGELWLTLGITEAQY
ncbi:hypothetical protein Tco_0922975 [Tanacetum coccineum]|uniref:DUF4283 domain-containing protein n=1 Tax=Tanacetum coccineum TaxID=301880 RepID=A0ABQ5CZN4_9ASTR